jgi:hypothetical protein
MRLLASDPLPPLPSAEQLLDSENPRRPGEAHEALPLPAGLAEKVAAESAALGITNDLGATLLIEAGLILADTGPAALALSGESGCPDAALSAGVARYVRALTIGRRPGERRGAAPGVVAIPVRLVTRVAGHSLEDLTAEVELERALSWELAAVLEGRTMAEWVFRHRAERRFG